MICNDFIGCFFSVLWFVFLVCNKPSLVLILRRVLVGPSVTQIKISKPHLESVIPFMVWKQVKARCLHQKNVARGCDSSLWEWEINHRRLWLWVPCRSVISDAFPGVWITLWRDHKTAVYITDYRRFSSVFMLQLATYFHFPIIQWKLWHHVIQTDHLEAWQTADNFSLQGSNFRSTVKILFRSEGSYETH